MRASDASEGGAETLEFGGERLVTDESASACGTFLNRGAFIILHETDTNSNRTLC